MDNSLNSQKVGDNLATRRNTRSTSNQEKEKSQDTTETSKVSSSNMSAKDNSSVEVTKKKLSDRVEKGPNGDVISYTTEDDITYRPSDSAYLETTRSDAPYSLCTIQEIKVSKRDSAVVYVKWYYRPTEVPDLVYQMLIKNRYNQVEDPSIKSLIMTPDVINRELFLDERLEATDTFPISSLKGKCDVTHYNDISELKNFELRPDHFFYICSYSPENRRLASSKGETRVGPSHQWSARMRGMFQKAELPDLVDASENVYEKSRVYEEMTWEPNVNTCDLVMCLRAARSLAAFAGVCDGVLPEEGCVAAFRDDTTINALRVLFENNGNPRKAIDHLVKNPVPLTIESKWTEEQVKRFQRGLRHHGKNFFRIRKELLPMKDTADLVEFYYLSKKTQENLMIRPHHRKHRRQAALKKNEGKQKNCNYGSGDHTSTEEETESEESEKEISTKCMHCQKSTVSELEIGGKENLKLCLDCRLFYKKYGENRPVVPVDEVEPVNEPDMDSSPPPVNHVPPFLFKPIKEEKLNNLLPRKQGKPLAKVKPTVEMKPTKREWTQDIETEITGSTAFKRPKSEPQEVNELPQHSEKKRPGAFIQNDVPYREAKLENPTPDSKPFPLQSQQLINPHEDGKVTSQTINKPNNVTSVDEYPASSNRVPDVSHAAISPFVPTPQTSQRLSVKPSELEAISKLARSPVPMSGTRFPPRSTRPTSPSRVAGQGNSMHSCSTTVTTTNGIRPSASIEPSNSNFPKPHFVEEQNTKDIPSHSRIIAPNNPHENSPLKLPPDNRSNPYPGPGVHRGFPFDPRVTDRIISNANMPRTLIKEEVRPLSPPRHRDGGLSHAPLRQGSPVYRTMKQEPHTGYPVSHPGRILPPGSSGYQHSTLAKNPHYSASSTSSHPSNHGTHPEYANTSAPIRSSNPQDGGDSDVELIRETRPQSPPVVKVEIPCNYGSSARFFKILDRGNNSCFRTDFIFSADETSRRKRLERLREEKKKQQNQSDSGESNKAPPQKRPLTPPSSSSNKGERLREEKVDSRDRQRREGGPPSAPGPSHATHYRSTPSHGSVPRSTPTATPTTVFEQHHRPPHGAFVPPYGQDMPALRQLQQIASNDMRRYAALGEGGMPVGPTHPLYPYYLAGLDPETAERELRERERLAKMGDIKPHDLMNPNVQALHQNPLAAAAAAGLHVGGLPGQHMAAVEQLQYQGLLAGHPHPALAAALAANLPPGAIAPGHPLANLAQAEAMAVERMQAERLAAEQYQLELLHHHSHSHVHSHLHLHPPSQPGGPPPTATPIPIAVPPPSSHALAVDPLLHPYAAAAAMGPLASGSNPLIAQSMLRSQQAAAAQAALMQQGLAPHLQAAAIAREQAAAVQQHPFSQHLQAVNEQHVIESQQRARAVAALQEQQYLAHAARFKP